MMFILETVLCGADFFNPIVIGIVYRHFGIYLNDARGSEDWWKKFKFKMIAQQAYTMYRCCHCCLYDRVSICLHTRSRFITWEVQKEHWQPQSSLTKPTLGSRCVILFLDFVSKQEVIASVQNTMTKPEVSAASVLGTMTKPEVSASCQGTMTKPEVTAASVQGTMTKPDVTATVQNTMTKPEVTAASVQGTMTKPEVTANVHDSMSKPEVSAASVQGTMTKPEETNQNEQTVRKWTLTFLDKTKHCAFVPASITCL